MPTTVAFLNQKGGVGKTSSCYHLSAALARLGQRVLLVDNDPQASLTQGFVGPEGLCRIAPGSSVVAVYDPEWDPAPESLIRPTGVPGVALVPGSPALNAWNLPPRLDWGAAPHGLRGFLREAAGLYDLALIDCPPNLLLCAAAALLAADLVVIPLQAEDFGSQGLAPVLSLIESVQAAANPRLALGGLLLTLFDKRLAVHTTYESMLRERYEDDVFRAVVPRAKDYVEAVTHRRPVGIHKPRSAAARAIVAVAGELLERAGLVGTEAAPGRVA